MTEKKTKEKKQQEEYPPCPLCGTVGRVSENATGGGAARGGDKYYCYECSGTFS